MFDGCLKSGGLTHGPGKDSFHSLRRCLIPGEEEFTFVADAVEVLAFMGDEELARGMIDCGG